MASLKLSPGGDNLIAAMVQRAELKRGETLLDIGCGDGETIAILSKQYGLTCTGIDQHETEEVESSSRAKRGNPACEVETAWDREWPEGPYDAVLFQCVLSTMDDLTGAVHAAAALLAPGGRLIVADLCGRKGVTPGGALNTDALDAICRSIGLVPVWWEDRTVDLGIFAAEVIFRYGSFDAYFSSVERPLSAFCRLDPAGPPPGYFLAVYRKEVV
jgi:2-polyprenyl-3-methyl-5-hydroxy-6-metoxy-1,4-benzoquinol methylase